jgi:cell division cycle protein 20 (cofactor of APC complex)
LIALGFSNSQVHIRDFEKDRIVREIDDHWARISAVAWNPSAAPNFCTSSKDCEILNYDMRSNRPINVFRGHSQEVCGLKWSPDGSLLASGGNDNMLMIWDARKSNAPLLQFSEHKAAVKALAWCPWQKNLICSGGGSKDKTVKFWKVDEGKMLSSHNISSQVCSLIWNPLEKELLSAHGYSQYQLTLWKYPTMEIYGELFGHKDRVLHLALSPDCSTVVSAGADETLRFWKIFEHSKSTSTLAHSKSILAPLTIR